MARVNPQILSFSGGEVGSRALARADLDIYPRTAEIAENVTLSVQGGMAKAPGTQFLRETPANAATVLRPFVFSTADTFVIELSPNKLRLIQGDGYVTLEGAPATIGAWSDESGAPPAGGGSAPPNGGSSGIGDPIGPGGGGGRGGRDFSVLV